METTVYGKLTYMFSAAREHLGPDELESIADFNEIASTESQNLSRVCEAIGCLVATDEGGNGFADRDSVAMLLFHVAHCTDVIAALTYVGDEARFERKRRKERAHQEAKP